MSEATLNDRVVYRLKKHGWSVAHAHRAFIPDVGWITPMAAGWPDLTCVKAGHAILFIELKKQEGVVEPEQQVWLELLNRTGNYAIVVRPSDLRLKKVDAIVKAGAPLG